MIDPLQKLVHDMKSVRLTEPEKTSMRGHLLQFMNEHPASEPSRLPVADPSDKPAGFLGSFLLFLVPRPMPVFAALLIIAVSGGSLSFAAKSSLPGDLLYPVKVSVNEEVTALFKVTEADKLQWEITRSERRLAEADRLKQRGTLNDAALARLSTGIGKHDTAIERLESQLQLSGQNEIALALQTEYESKLKLYQEVLVEVLASPMPTASTPVPVVAVEPGREPAAVVAAAPPPIPKPEPARDATEPTLTNLVREHRQPTPDVIVPYLKEAQVAQDQAKQTFSEVSQYVDDAARTTGYDRMGDALSTLKKARAYYDEGGNLTQKQQYREAYEQFLTSYNLSSDARGLAYNALQSFAKSPPAPNPTPILPPAPVDPQVQWADPAKAQAQASQASYDKAANYLGELSQAWGREPFSSVANRFASAKDALIKGNALYNEGSYEQAHRLFTESYNLIDQGLRDAMNILDNLVEDQRVEVKIEDSKPLEVPLKIETKNVR